MVNPVFVVKMPQLSFKNQKLKVDWIGFNCEKLSESDLKIIAEFLSEYGFNSTFMKKKDQGWESRQLITRTNNHFEVELKQYFYRPEKKEFWAGTKINFTGENANYFYSRILSYYPDKTFF